MSRKYNSPDIDPDVRIFLQASQTFNYNWESSLREKFKSRSLHQ